MDGSLPTGNSASICDLCGYSRHGLPVGTACPECGEPPPTFSRSVGTPRSTEELRWLSGLAIGFWLLVVSWAGALQVALIMPLGELSIGAINYPGPKLFASALVQRTIGGRPGLQGVFGTLCVLVSGVALFLLTEPRIVQSRSESVWSLRRRARWIGLLSLGGFSGFVLSGFDQTVAYGGSLSINLFAIGVCCCELPANALLYIYLRDLSRRLGDRRATQGLRICVIAVPTLTVIAVLMLGFGSAAKEDFSTAWRLGLMVYGAAALGVGVIGTVAVLRLTWTVSLAAFGKWGQIARCSTVRLPQLLRQSAERVDRNWASACAVVGLLMWLYSVPLCIQNVLYTPIRTSFGGDTPMINFPGPKISVYTLNRAAAERPEDEEVDRVMIPMESQIAADAFTLLAAWLVTYPIPGVGGISRWRWAARYGVLSIVGASVGTDLSMTDLSSLGPSHFTVWALLTTEVPATFILYTYLSRLAAGLADAPLARRLRQLAWCAAILAITPLPCFLFSGQLHAWRGSWLAGAFSAVYVTFTLAATLVAACSIAKLAYKIALRAMTQNGVSQLA